MAQGNPLPGEKYLHFKNRMYQVTAVAYHSETMEKYVVYQALYGDFKNYIRPYDMFISEVDHEKYPEVEQKYRFQLVEPEMDETVSRKNTDVNENPALAGNTVGEKNTATTDAKNVTEEKFPEPDIAEDTPVINPWLDKVLDAESYEEKYDIVCQIKGEITDKLIDDIATVLDLSIPEGELDERYNQLKYCIRTRQRYESERFR